MRRSSINGHTVLNSLHRIGLHRNRVFFRFLLAYCLILSLTHTVSLSLYSRLVQRTEQYVTDRIIAGLHQSQYIVKQHLAQIQWNVIRISEDLKFKSILAAARAGTRISNYEIKEITDLVFNDIAYRNDLVTTCFAYLKDLHLVITPDGVYKADFFYNNIFQCREGVAWIDELNSTYHAGRFFPARSISTSGFYSQVIPYVHSLPMGYNREPEGYIVYFINEEIVQSLLDQVGVPQDGWMAVFDEQGELLTGIHHEKITELGDLPTMTGDSGSLRFVTGGREFLVVFAATESGGWKHVAAFPASFIRDMVQNIRTITWVCFAFLLILGFACACFFAYWNSRPIEAICRMMGEESGENKSPGTPRFNQLDRVVSGLLRNSDFLRHSLKEKTEYVRVLFFEWLLRGEFRDHHHLEAMRVQAGIPADSSLYIIVLMRLGIDSSVEQGLSLKDIHLFRSLLHDTIGRTFGGRCFVHDLDGENSLLLLGFHTEDVKECMAWVEEYVGAFYASLPDDLSLRIVFTGGEAYNNLLEIHKSYEQALDALHWVQDRENSGIVWFSRTGINKCDYFYPLEMESRLLSALRSGETKRVEDILLEMLCDNFQDRPVSVQAQKALLFELCGTVHKLRDHAEKWERMLKIVEHAESSYSIRKAFDFICAQCRAICDTAGERRQQDQAHLMARAIVRHLETRLADQQLSLSSIAQKFGRTEAYVSVFFKEQIGMNLSHYLEKLRLDKAVEYLLDTDLPIHTVARKVGYNSDKAFRRAFKRVLGVSPNIFKATRRAEQDRLPAGG